LDGWGAKATLEIFDTPWQTFLKDVDLEVLQAYYISIVEALGIT